MPAPIFEFLYPFDHRAITNRMCDPHASSTFDVAFGLLLLLSVFGNLALKLKSCLCKYALALTRNSRNGTSFPFRETRSHSERRRCIFC